MKKYIYGFIIVLLATVTMTSCAVDEGTEPGSDSNPAVTIYQYKATKPYNSDNDVILRFATNSKTSEAYYLAEKTKDKEANVASLGQDGYMDYVVSKGKKIENVSGESNIDVTLTDLFGEYTITAVAVGQGKKALAETVFSGLDWTDVVSGTYYFAKKALSGTPSATITGLTSNPTVLQVCTTNADLYRFKDVFGKGSHLKISLLKDKNSDEGGEYRFFRIPVTETPFTLSGKGTVSVRDVGYWQGNDSFVTNPNYGSGMYGDYNCFLCITYYVTAGTVGYGYDEFVKD